MDGSSSDQSVGRPASLANTCTGCRFLPLLRLHRVARMQDCLFRLWSEAGAVGPMYRAQLRVMCAGFCPEGVPSVWMPSEKQQACWEAEEPLPDWTPASLVPADHLRAGASLRGRVWSGALSCVEAAALSRAQAAG